MSRAILHVVLALALLAAPLAAEAQQARRVYRIGILEARSAADSSAFIESFRTALREVDHREGHDTMIESRFADGETGRLSNLATELVGLKPDVLVASSGDAVRALQFATPAIPIVMAGADPETRIVGQNLARPTGNITGVISISRELEPKRMQLLRDILPRVSRVATLLDYTAFPYREGRMSISRSERWGFTFIAIVVSGPDDFEGAFAVAAIQERVEALSLSETPMLYTHRRRLAQLAIKNRLSWIAGDRDYAEAGCLISYGADRNELARRAVIYVDKILKGAKPADLPIEQPTKFELVINLKTAKTLALTIPQSVLLRADEVIQ